VRPKSPASVYLESNTLIRTITKKPGYEPVAEVLRLADSGKLTVLISMLTYVEVRGWGKKDPYPEALDKEGIRLLDSPSLVRIELSRRVAVRARECAWRYALNNYDALHLASALEYPADVLMTWDTDFKFPRSIEGVWVDEPYEFGDPTLI
jgi:predicted nucleic acid-binding protein